MISSNVDHPSSAEELLSAPRSEGNGNKIGRRAECPIKGRSERFLIGRERMYTQQYSHLYYKRLISMKPLLEAQAQKKWAKDLSGKTDSCFKRNLTPFAHIIRYLINRGLSHLCG